MLARRRGPSRRARICTTCSLPAGGSSPLPPPGCVPFSAHTLLCSSTALSQLATSREKHLLYPFVTQPMHTPGPLSRLALQTTGAARPRSSRYANSGALAALTRGDRPDGPPRHRRPQLQRGCLPGPTRGTHGMLSRAPTRRYHPPSAHPPSELLVRRPPVRGLCAKHISHSETPAWFW